MNIYEEYQKKLVTAQEAVKLVKNGDWVDYSKCCSFPEDLDAALAARKDELKDVNVRNAISMKPIQVVEQDPEQKAFTYNLWHCSGIDRKYIDQGRAFFSPMIFRNCGSYYQRGFAAVNVARLYDMDPEELLTRACEKFISRFTKVEKMADKEQIDLLHTDSSVLDRLWNEAKK